MLKDMIDEIINFKITLEGDSNHGYKDPVRNKFTNSIVLRS